MKIGLNLYPDTKNLPLSSLKEGILNAQNLSFAKQLGVNHIVAWMPLPPGEGYWEFLDLLRLKKFVESYGLKLEAIENLPPVHYDRILYDIDGKERQVENIKRTITNMGKAGINCLGYCFTILGYWGHWRTGEGGGGRGNAGITSFDYSMVKDAPHSSMGLLWGNWKTDYFNPSDTIEKVNREMMWKRLCYLLDRIIPVAEEAGVKLCIHPSDPPAPALGGEERIMNCPEDFKELIELYPSDYHGIQFCQGTFSEMEGVGKKVVGLIEYFGTRKKIFYVHFRNVHGTFPLYEETFIDDGDTDMALAFKAYKDAGFEGVLIPDHVPVVNSVSNPWHTGMAHSIGYIKSLMDTCY